MSRFVLTPCMRALDGVWRTYTSPTFPDGLRVKLRPLLHNLGYLEKLQQMTADALDAWSTHINRDRNADNRLDAVLPNDLRAEPGKRNVVPLDTTRRMNLRAAIGTIIVGVEPIAIARDDIAAIQALAARGLFDLDRTPGDTSPPTAFTLDLDDDGRLITEVDDVAPLSSGLVPAPVHERNIFTLLRLDPGLFDWIQTEAEALDRALREDEAADAKNS